MFQIHIPFIFSIKTVPYGGSLRMLRLHAHHLSGARGGSGDSMDISNVDARPRGSTRNASSVNEYSHGTRRLPVHRAKFTDTDPYKRDVIF